MQEIADAPCAETAEVAEIQALLATPFDNLTSEIFQCFVHRLCRQPPEAAPGEFGEPAETDEAISSSLRLDSTPVSPLEAATATIADWAIAEAKVFVTGRGSVMITVEYRLGFQASSSANCDHGALAARGASDHCSHVDLTDYLCSASQLAFSLSCWFTDRCWSVALPVGCQSKGRLRLFAPGTISLRVAESLIITTGHVQGGCWSWTGLH